ncbi:MAG: integrase core domain-containing protein [Planctomycetota bacterium]
MLVRFAKQTDWGYSKMQGELKKLGFGYVPRTTIQNNLKREGIDPGPGRGPTLWDDFIARHAETLWAVDFLSVKAWTPKGLRQMHLLAFVQVETRQVWVSPCTLHPTKDWVAQQARNFLMHVESTGLPGDLLLRVRDGKFAPIFDIILETSGIDVKVLPVRSPNLNAFAERFAQTIKHECLNHFVILGHKHLDYLMATFVDYYHTQRPHQSKENKPLLRLTESPPPNPDGEVLCEERLGGLLKHYYRKAA